MHTNSKAQYNTALSTAPGERQEDHKSQTSWAVQDSFKHESQGGTQLTHYQWDSTCLPFQVPWLSSCRLKKFLKSTKQKPENECFKLICTYVYYY